MIKAAQDDVKSETSRNCFAKAGFQITVEPVVELLEEELEGWAEISNGVKYEDYLCVDEDIAVFGQKSEAEIITEVLNKTKTVEEFSDEEEINNVFVPASYEALKMIENIRVYTESRENVDDTLFQAVEKLESFILIEKKKNLKQKKLTSYLSALV